MRPPLRSARLLDQLRERIRYAHYSLRTEKTYLYWVRFFIRFHGLTHPKQMGAKDIEAFLSFLANERKVAPSTHRQALAAILYLYKEVLDIQLPWLDQIGRPKARTRIPVVLSREEVGLLLGAIDEQHRLICQLLYGAGLRLMECITLRVKDLDFDRRTIIVRNGKGGKDRVVMLPAPLVDHSVINSPTLVHSGQKIAPQVYPECGCPKRSAGSIPERPQVGLGTGSFPLQRSRLIQEPKYVAVIIGTSKPLGERLLTRSRKHKSQRKLQRTRCAIPSRLTYWTRVLISVASKSSWATVT
jgi:hypothetical protein